MKKKASFDPGAWRRHCCNLLAPMRTYIRIMKAHGHTDESAAAEFNRLLEKGTIQKVPVGISGEAYKLTA